MARGRAGFVHCATKPVFQPAGVANDKAPPPNVGSGAFKAPYYGWSLVSANLYSFQIDPAIQGTSVFIFVGGGGL